MVVAAMSVVGALMHLCIHISVPETNRKTTTSSSSSSLSSSPKPRRYHAPSRKRKGRESERGGRKVAPE